MESPFKCFMRSMEKESTNILMTWTPTIALSWCWSEVATKLPVEASFSTLNLSDRQQQQCYWLDLKIRTWAHAWLVRGKKGFTDRKVLTRKIHLMPELQAFFLPSPVDAQCQKRTQRRGWQETSQQPPSYQLLLRKSGFVHHHAADGSSVAPFWLSTGGSRQRPHKGVSKLAPDERWRSLRSVTNLLVN